MGKIELNDLKAMEKEALEVLHNIRSTTRKQYPWNVVGQIAWLVFYMIGFSLVFTIVGVMTGWWEPNDWTGAIVAFFVFKIGERLGM